MSVEREALLELAARLDRVMDSIEVVKEKQKEMAENINEIKDAVFHPDKGVYARLRDLEKWKATSTRLLWILVTSFAALTTTAIWSKFFS